MKNTACIFFCVLFACIGFKAYPSNTLVINDIGTDYSVGLHIDVLEDAEGTLTMNEVVGNPNFQPVTQNVPNLEITNSAFWVRFSVKNETAINELLLNLAYPIIDSVYLFSPNVDGTYDAIASGESIPVAERKFKHQNFMFNITLDKGQVKTYYLRLKSGEQIMVPLSVGTPTAVMKSIASMDLYSGIYFGIVMVMLLYNLFIYFSVRDKSYLLYVVYILFVGLTQAGDNGYTYKYFWPNMPWLANLSAILFPALVGSTAVIFMRHFLQTAKHTPKLDKMLLFFIGLYGLCVSLFIASMPQVGYQLIQVTALLTSLCMLSTSVIIMRKGFRPAKFFVMGWSVFLVTVCIFVMKDLGVLPYNTLTYHILKIGSGIELIMLSLALADRINTLKKEKEESQQRTLEALKENERIMREQNIILDTKVKERTAELQQTNNELNVALTDLKEAQGQLVQAEKMASLGLLTAGIAHEINNPINYIVSSISPLKRDIQDILELLNSYEDIQDAETLKEKLEEIQHLKEDIELEYVLEEIEQLLKGMDEGAKHTAEIVKGLRTFSRLDETDRKQADVNECLESTLLLLGNSITTETEVIKNYGDLKMLECFPGKLNQLLMNILKNALQAMEMKTYQEGEKPRLAITTIERVDEVEIQIEDNGVGMSEEVKSKIFEPFFTTKDVGQGTGLGLSIAFNIVEKHEGMIDVETKEGVGTTMTVIIPKTITPEGEINHQKINTFKKDRPLTDITDQSLTGEN